MAAIGFLLLEWGLLEKQLHGEPVPDELNSVRAMRNAICHGLEAAFAAPADGSPPFILCRSAGGAMVKFTHEELVRATRALRAASHRYGPTVDGSLRR